MCGGGGGVCVCGGAIELDMLPFQAVVGDDSASYARSFIITSGAMYPVVPHTVLPSGGQTSPLTPPVSFMALPSL